MTSIEYIDVVLNLLATNDELKSSAKQEEIFEVLLKTHDFGTQTYLGADLLAVLDKLVKDGYVKRSEVERYYSTNSTATYIELRYSITFEGALFHQQGGYLNQLNNQNAENTRLETLERNQMANANRMTALTKVLAYATIALVLIELVKLLIEHNPFSCR